MGVFSGSSKFVTKSGNELLISRVISNGQRVIDSTLMSCIVECNKSRYDGPIVKVVAKDKVTGGIYQLICSSDTEFPVYDETDTRLKVDPIGYCKVSDLEGKYLRTHLGSHLGKFIGLSYGLVTKVIGVEPKESFYSIKSGKSDLIYLNSMLVKI